MWSENFTVCEKLHAELLVARLEIDEGGNLHMYWLCQMAVRPTVIRRWGYRLTGVCLMAVRNRVPGFMGGRWHKRREWRIRLQIWSPQTHWQMSGFVPLKGARKRKDLWIKGPLLSFWCGALSPADHSQRKGRVMARLQASVAKQNKTIKCGGLYLPLHQTASTSLKKVSSSCYFWKSIWEDAYSDDDKKICSIYHLDLIQLIIFSKNSSLKLRQIYFSH